jgi:hypothetical protein
MSKQSDRVMKLKAELASLTDDSSCQAFAVHIPELPAPLVFNRCDATKRRCGKCGNGRVPRSAPRRRTDRRPYHLIDVQLIDVQRPTERIRWAVVRSGISAAGPLPGPDLPAERRLVGACR